MNSEEIGKKNINNCPLRYALNIIGGKWRLPIIWALWENGTLRYNELKRIVDGITNMMLSQSLKKMENYGLVARKHYMEIPPRVEYSLTEEGMELVKTLESLAKWGKNLQKK